MTEYERGNLTNRVILALPADYEPLPGPMCREVAADMEAHKIGRGGCGAKEWGLLD